MVTSKRKPEIDLVAELGRVFQEGIGSSGEAIEAIAMLLADPGADHTAGELAKLGAAFTFIGKGLSDAARSQAVMYGLKADADVIFTYREPHVQERINTKYLKAKFPMVNYPDMWQLTEVSGSVAIDLPFKV